VSDQGIILEYRGQIDYKLIDNLLKKIKRSKEFLILDRTSGKRLYAIIVECLENIAKHSEKLPDSNEVHLPHISILKSDEILTIITGNPVLKSNIDLISEKIDQVNRKNEKSLTALYGRMINKEILKNGNSAGLGFIIMKLKSGNNLNYRFISINETASYFEIKISLKKYIMRKLVIDQTASSPKVVLDPEKRVFEISGESRPPDVGSFYSEILMWMDDYSGQLLKSQESREPVVFNFDFEYFNSSSAKYILDFCKQIASVRSKGKDIDVKWHYEDDDMDMLEVGREMSRMAKLPFEFVQKKGQ
jgi:SiaC family regulatory phosphoprotein/Family of unknown function (DUF6272)